MSSFGPHYCRRPIIIFTSSQSTLISRSLPTVYAVTCMPISVGIVLKHRISYMTVLLTSPLFYTSGIPCLQHSGIHQANICLLSISDCLSPTKISKKGLLKVYSIHLVMIVLSAVRFRVIAALTEDRWAGLTNYALLLFLFSFPKAAGVWTFSSSFWRLRSKNECIP